MAHAESQEERPLPLVRRRGLAYPTLIWSGFSAAFGCVYIGDRLQYALGTIDAFLSVALGNWLLFLYSAAIAFACGRWGMNFPLSVKAVFGDRGAALPGIMLGLLVIGWSAFQIELTATLIDWTFGAGAGSFRPALIVATAAVFALPIVFNPKGGFAVVALALPCMIFFGVYCLAAIIPPFRLTLFDSPLPGALPFMQGIMLAFGTFIVSGTMTGDIVRFSRTGNQAVVATAVALLLSNTPFMLLGVLLAASAHSITDLFTAAAMRWVAYPLFVAAFLSNWAAADACLINATTAVKSFLSIASWWKVASVLTLLATIGAAAGLMEHLFQWIALLAILVPPVGAIMIVDYYVFRSLHGYSVARYDAVNWSAIFSLAFGVATSSVVHSFEPGWFFPLAGFFVAAIVYLILAMASGARPGVEVGVAATEAEAIE